VETLSPREQQQAQAHGLRGRRVYFKATPAGKAAHKRWLASQVKDERWRIELLARIFTGASLGSESLLKFLAAYQHHAVVDTRRIEQQLAERQDAQEDLATLTVVLALQELKMTLAAQLKWSRIAIQSIHDYNRRAAHGGEKRAT
jgi:hypothetical protein